MKVRLTVLSLLAGSLSLAAACTPGGEDVDPRVEEILALDPDPDQGGVVFEANCTASGCHGPTGDDGLAPALSNRVPNLSDEQLLLTMLDGTSRMPAQSQLDEQDKCDVLAYITEVFD